MIKVPGSSISSKLDIFERQSRGSGTVKTFRINPLLPELFFLNLFSGHKPEIDSFRLPTHATLIGNFLMIPSYFKIEILATHDEFVRLEHKGLIVMLQ